MTGKRWSKKEESLLADVYDDWSIASLEKTFGRKMSSISAKAHRMLLPTRQNLWSESDSEYLLKNYETENKEKLVRRLNRNWAAIVAKAMSVGLSRKNNSFQWDDDKKGFLKENYWDGNRDEILSYLGIDSDNWSNVIKQANKMGLKRNKSFREWTQEDLNTILNLYSDTPYRVICENIGIPYTKKSIEAIKRRARKMGVQRNILGPWQNKTDDELLTMFKDVINKIGYVPLASNLKKYGLPDSRIYTHRFGKYEEFVLDFFGKDINASGMFGRRGRSKDGTFCLSHGEVLITNFLFDNKIFYRKEVPYSEIIPKYKKSFRMDWLLFDNSVVEFFGLMSKKYYKKKADKKIKILKENKIKLIDIYPKDLSQSSLRYMFREYL